MTQGDSCRRAKTAILTRDAVPGRKGDKGKEGGRADERRGWGLRERKASSNERECMRKKYGRKGKGCEKGQGNEGRGETETMRSRKEERGRGSENIGRGWQL